MPTDSAEAPPSGSSGSGKTRAPFFRQPLEERRDRAEETVLVAAACEAGIFGALAEERADAPGLARRLDLEDRATGIALAFLEDLGLLEADGEGRYGLAGGAREILADPSSEEYAAGGLPHWLNLVRAFARLSEALESGGPLEAKERRGDGDGSSSRERSTEELARFMAAMNAAPRERVRRVVDLSLERVSEAEGGRALDLGGGPGHFSRELARRGMEVVLFDRPETVDFVGREYDLEDAEGIRLHGGDFLDDPLPEGPFDLVLVSNILHIYDPATNARILEKVAGVTAPRGVCAVADFVRGESPRAARFALIMLLKTDGGDTYSVEDHEEWLEAAGFHDVRLDDVDEARQLLTAVRS